MPLFFDTETTGFLNKDLPLTHSNQPHIIQIAAILDDEQREIRASINLIINAGCGAVPEGAYKVHGINQATYEKFGVSYMVALATFHELCYKADILVGHNISYDLSMLKIAYNRVDKGTKFSSGVQNKTQFCTMLNTVDVVKISKPRGGAGYKWPKLDEAYRVLVNAEGFENAHDAMADVMACREVFYSLKK